MKSIAEILGGCQMLLDISYDLQDIFEGYLGNEHRTFLHMLRVIEEHAPPWERAYVGRGRRAYAETPIIRAHLAGHFFQCPTTVSLRQRLQSDSTLRQICGFSTVPSEATFSRRYTKYAKHRIMERTLAQIVTEYHEGTLVGHISRDSTAICARETPMNKKKDVAPKKNKRGRPKKGAEPQKVPSRIEMQLSQSAEEALAELNGECNWGCKRNSQGNRQYWKGYTLHLDVTDIGIPISAAVTGANVHDSQVAIPLEKMTEQRVTHLYSLMDAAYDAQGIKEYITSKQRVALIDPNKRCKQAVPMDPAAKQRFKIRSTVERSNAHLKDWLLPSNILVRGHEKVTHCLMTFSGLLGCNQNMGVFHSAETAETDGVSRRAPYNSPFNS